PNGDAAAPRIQPAFFHEMKEHRYEIRILYPRILEANSPAHRAFNKAAQDLALHNKNLESIRSWESESTITSSSELSTTYQISYLTPRLSSTVYAIEFYYAGTPHPDWENNTLIFDFSLGRVLALTDVLEEPPKAVPAISQLCKNAFGEDT